MVSLSPHAGELERIRRSRLPTVLVDAHHRALPRVVADDVRGGRLATEHLIELGHRRIGFIGDIPRVPLAFTSSRLRLSGFRRAMELAGLAVPADLIGIGDHSRHRAAELAHAMLVARRPPTAIVCASDTQAAGVIEAAVALGRSVPDELSVTGYDDLELADHLHLTTIRQPLFESGVRARPAAARRGRGPPREAAPGGPADQPRRPPDHGSARSAVTAVGQVADDQPPPTSDPVSAPGRVASSIPLRRARAIAVEELRGLAERDIELFTVRLARWWPDLEESWAIVYGSHPDGAAGLDRLIRTLARRYRERHRPFATSISSGISDPTGSRTRR